MPSVVMSVTPAFLPNPTSQSSLSGATRVRSPELNGSHPASINPESPDSEEESIMATGSQNEDAVKDTSSDKITNVEENIPAFPNTQEDQCSLTQSPAKSESAASPSFTSADSGISISPVLGSRDDRRGNKSGSISTKLAYRDTNEAPSTNQGPNHYPNSDECPEGDERNSNVAGRNLNLITCQDCGLICAGQSHYQVHIRSHTGERPFKCTICGVAFTQKGNLRRHYKIHSDEKPFQCPICSYRCRRRDALNGHMRIHSDVRPYRCVYCARSYKSRQSLKEHEFQCPYKKDPVLPDDSPGRKSNSETHRSLSEPGQSPGYRDEDLPSNNATPEQISPSGAANSGLMQMDSSKYNYLRSVAGNFKNSQTMASFFAQALTASAISTPGKRKSTNPQKIPRYKDFPTNLPLLQLQAPMLHQNAFGLRENERAASSSSPLHMPPLPLPFIPPNMLSVLQQHQIRQAAVNASLQANSQHQALDFSTGRQSDRMQDETTTDSIDPHTEGNDGYYDERNATTSAKLSGSAKRKRPKYLNERIVDVEYPENFAKKSRESSPDVDKLKEYEQGKITFRDEDRRRETAQSPDNASSKQMPSLLRIKDEATAEVLRVFKSTSQGTDSTTDTLQNSEELKSYFCKHCRCLFLDEVMYAIHAGCHGFQDPFECNICGFRACDRFQFQSHMTRCEHSESTSSVPYQKSPSPSHWQYRIPSSLNETSEMYSTRRKQNISDKRWTDSDSSKSPGWARRQPEIDRCDSDR